MKMRKEIINSQWKIILGKTKRKMQKKKKHLLVIISKKDFLLFRRPLLRLGVFLGLSLQRSQSWLSWTIINLIPRQKVARRHKQLLSKKFRKKQQQTGLNLATRQLQVKVKQKRVALVLTPRSLAIHQTILALVRQVAKRLTTTQIQLLQALVIKKTEVRQPIRSMSRSCSTSAFLYLISYSQWKSKSLNEIHCVNLVLRLQLTSRSFLMETLLPLSAVFNSSSSC